ERNWPRGTEWYAPHFEPRANVRGESSPCYTAYPQHQGVAERMHATVPDARLIYLVRDPLERIAAHWVHNYAKRRERGDLRATLLHPQTSYVARSRYHMQLEQFLRFYDRERLVVIEQDELRLEREATLRRVFEFIGVDPDFTHPRFREERHQTSRKLRSSRLPLRLGQARRGCRRRQAPAQGAAGAGRQLGGRPRYEARPLRRPAGRLAPHVEPPARAHRHLRGAPARARGPRRLDAAVVPLGQHHAG